MHPNMRDRVRLLQMTLHWHMTGERHFRFLTGRDIGPEQRAAHSRDASRREPRSAREEAGEEGARAGGLGGGSC